jgi:ketosteroid isomerase-like protein
MSELSERQRENMEATRRAFETYMSGDIEGVLADAHPDVEVYLPPTLPNSGTFRGHDGYLTWVSSWLDAWEDFTIEILAMDAIGERHVLTTVRQSGTGRGSGIRVEMEAAYVTEIRDGKFAALQLYTSVEEARRIAEQRDAERPE